MSISPTTIELNDAREKAFKLLKIDVENYKNSKFPVKTGYLKNNTRVSIIGEKVVIEAPDYIQFHDFFEDFKNFVREKFRTHLQEELQKIGGQQYGIIH